jgi:PAS domain S-box-containing protein
MELRAQFLVSVRVDLAPRGDVMTELLVHPGTPAAAIGHRDARLDIFENGPVPLHVVDGRGIIIDANRAELELLGYDAEDYIGHSIAQFHADPAVIGDIIDKLQRGQTITAYPARLRARDGSIKHVEITSNGHFEHG